MAPIHGAVLLAAVWCGVALTVLFRGANSFGSRRLFAPASGDAAAGVRYAFTKGMAPQAKESVRMNPLSYLAGMLYHLGVFAALALLGLRLIGLHAPKALAFLALAGALSGMALLFKRLIKANLRGLSCLDDFLSNLLVTSFAALSGLAVLRPGLESVWMLEATLLLVYAPLGKIRHCIFFFSTRYHAGAFFGRRGVFPPAEHRA